PVLPFGNRRWAATGSAPPGARPTTTLPSPAFPAISWPALSTILRSSRTSGFWELPASTAGSRRSSWRTRHQQPLPIRPGVFSTPTLRARFIEHLTERFPGRRSGIRLFLAFRRRHRRFQTLHLRPALARRADSVTPRTASALALRLTARTMWAWLA